ncbi:TonB-dependent receptor family protein [Methyloglobulus sp.]|uniref:TonB-dependent receptor family protein n=1 Tax=Methyloglobulus sp. TaxID=2518622 RepID=UPI003988B2B8
MGDSGAGATSGSRISIRGSDINSFISPMRGLKILRDGLPYTNANGFTDTESLNFYAVDHINVYRGASALEYGSSNLGGAIDFITPTGYTADRLKVGMTYGTNGYVRPSISAGGVLGKGFDAFGSFSYIDTNTTRELNDQEQIFGYGNIGYRWNENHETRFSVDIQNHNYLAANPITKQQVSDNPQQNPDGTTLPQGFPVYRVDLRHSVKLADGDRFDIGAYYFDKDFTFSFPFGFFRDSWQDAGFSWRHEINGGLFGLKNKVVWGGLNQWMWIKDRNFAAAATPGGGFQRGVLLNQERDNWTNVEAYLEDQLSLTDTFTLVVGGQINYRKVDYERVIGFVPSPARPSNQADQDFFNFNPKLGFTWQATEEAQLYGNLSRSAEPPPLGNLSDVFLKPARTSQTASTVEIGTRGQTDWLKWDFAFYHAWLNDEILVIPTPPFGSGDFTTANAGKTQHTGIELALESTVPLDVITSGDQIRLSGNYTWNNFHFDSDKRLGDNRLPGIPEHIARVEALYQHPSGFYIGPNAQIASLNWVDFTNTLAARPYALLNARMGWDDGKHWKVFVDGRNLTNEYYTASVFITGNANGLDAAQFNPGATRSVFGGFEYRY